MTIDLDAEEITELLIGLNTVKTIYMKADIPLSKSSEERINRINLLEAKIWMRIGETHAVLK